MDSNVNSNNDSIKRMIKNNFISKKPGLIRFSRDSSLLDNFTSYKNTYSLVMFVVEALPHCSNLASIYFVVY